MRADERQVGGEHYKAVGDARIEHWNLVAAYKWDYFTAQVIKYMMRWKMKNGLQDLEKARHFLDKLIELEDEGVEPGPGYVNQDR